MYQIEFTKKATKQLNKLQNNIKECIDARVLELATDPRPPGVKKMKNSENSYRIRVGDYRVIYEIYDGVLLVSIVRVGHRSDIYEDV
jgi:mRNA interferase RelE/StbE